MGADQFWTSGWGANASAAFQEAVNDAKYESGHGGYTGTIAEKDSFLLFDPPEGVDYNTFAEWIEAYPYDEVKIPAEHQALVSKAAEVYDDKWGPAVCVPTQETYERDGNIFRRFIFLGWASA